MPKISRALPPCQNWNAAVEHRLDFQYLCLIALGGTQPCAACLCIARDIFPLPGFGISVLIQNYVADGRPRRWSLHLTKEPHPRELNPSRPGFNINKILQLVVIYYF